MEKTKKKLKTMLAETPAAYYAFRACVVTDSSRLADEFEEYLGKERVTFKSHLSEVIGEKECGVYIVDTKVSDMNLWPAPLLLEPGASSKSWLFLLASVTDASLLGATPADSAFFDRRSGGVEKVAFYLQNRLDPQSGKKIKGIEYVRNLRTFIVRMQNGRIYPLRLDDLPEADSSDVVRWAIDKSLHYFEVMQESGNALEVPWDAVLYHCEPEYEYYKGKQDRSQGLDRAIRIGSKVREWRIKKGLSITELAERAGMKRPNLSRLEHGQHLPSLETLERVADALVVPVAELVAVRTV